MNWCSLVRGKGCLGLGVGLGIPSVIMCFLSGLSFNEVIAYSFHIIYCLSVQGINLYCCGGSHEGKTHEGQLGLASGKI